MAWPPSSTTRPRRDRQPAAGTVPAQGLAGQGSRALILVTHDVNIGRWTGESVASGEMVLVQVDASGKPISHKVYARPD
jgi:hypothetical protein